MATPPRAIDFYAIAPGGILLWIKNGAGYAPSTSARNANSIVLNTSGVTAVKACAP